MNPGSYALRFHGVDKKYLEELGDAHFEERSDLLARSRRLSADTAKRRKNLALKRKLEAQKEEKRRQEILQKRREQIREATEKYQRGNKNYSAKDYELLDRYKTPTLEEALSAVRGRAGSANRTSYRSYSATMATGGVAQVRVSSAGSVQSTRSMVNNGTSRPHAAHYNYTGSKGVVPDRTQTQLHDNSLRNLNNSRSLFEQQLHHHQQLLVEQQKQSLHQFNAAIQKEMDCDPKLQGVEQMEDMDVRPDSPDSVDSLETSNNQDPQDVQSATANITAMVMVNDGTNHHNHSIQTSQNGVTTNVYNQKVGQNLAVINSSYVLHGLGSSQSPVAVVQPQVKQPSVQPVVEEKPVDKQASCQNETKHMEPLNAIDTKINGRTNGLYYQNAVIGHATELQPQNLNAAVKENVPVYHDAGHEFGMTAKTKAWVSPSPVAEQEVGVFRKNSEPYPDPSTKPQEVCLHEIAPYANEVSNSNTNTIPVQQKAVPLAVSIATPVQQKAVPLTVSSMGPVQQKAVPLGVSSMGPAPQKTPVQQRPAPSSTINTLSYFTAPQQNAAGARPLPVTSVTISTVGSNTRQASSIITTNPLTGPAMDMLKQYSQFPMYRVANGQEAEEQNSQISDASTLTSGSDVAEESQPEPEVRRVRGILKKVSSYGPPLPNQNAVNIGRGHILKRSMSAHTGLRDSLEITKIKKEHAVKRPKSVRFADVVYTDDSDSENSQPENKPNAMYGKPPPASLQNTCVVKNPSRIPRASSAGTERRKPFLRPHPPSHPPTGRAVVCRNNQKKSPDVSERFTANIVNRKTNVTSTPVDVHNDNTTTSNVNTELSKSQAVHDVNGLQLDRTPTDEEINCLWDTVRTCLSRQSNSSAVDSVHARNNATTVTQTPVVSHKHIDGNSLAPQFRVVTRVNSTYTNNYMGTTTVTNTQARKKVSMDVLNNFARRQSLLNQRNRQNAPKSATGTSQAPVSMTTHLIKPTEDTYQTANYRATSGPSLPQKTSDQPVSESLAAFLAAENLAKESVSDSQIEAAMDRAVQEQQVINTVNSQPRVPTALSIEEQRLMQSLERLNERLRLNETQMYPVSFAPNPPPYHAGFKGHQPIASSSTTKRQATTNGTVPRHAYRSGSAPIQRSTNYAGPYRYR